MAQNAAAAIEQKHASLLNQGILDLGPPVGGVTMLNDGGALQIFNLGRIYFHPRVGAFELHGLILETYVGMGESQSRLRYPVTDEVDCPDIAGGRMNGFEQGVLVFNPRTGAAPQFLVPQVVVKLNDAVPVNLDQGQSLQLSQFAALAGPFVAPAIIGALGPMLPDLQLRRLLDVVTPAQLRQSVAQAKANDPTYSPPNFENFLEIRCPLGFDTARLVTALSALPPTLVEHAYAVQAVEPANVVGTTNPFFPRQQYLQPAPVGVGAAAAWQKGADGTGCRLVDMEHAWLLNHGADDAHQDLPPNIPLLGGFNRREGRGHGAGVLGVIRAVDNAVGVVGLAPNSIIHAISPDDLSPDPLRPPREDVPGKLEIARQNLRFGDILLLEVQADKRPVESDLAIFALILRLVLEGIVVIECGGNGGLDLDTTPIGKFDSGAIVVGSCNSAAPHARHPVSNFGRRIDCKAWGENVFTSGKMTDPVKPDDYFNFSGTSSAGAIIAGVCLLIQDLHRRKHGAPLHPRELRNILRDPANCTVAPTAAVDKIGHMPDLAKIIANNNL